MYRSIRESGFLPYPESETCEDLELGKDYGSNTPRLQDYQIGQNVSEENSQNSLRKLPRILRENSREFYKRILMRIYQNSLQSSLRKLHEEKSVKNDVINS